MKWSEWPNISVFAACFLLLLVTVGFPARGAEVEPILTVTEAVAGKPLVMPVRLVGSGPPPSRVSLRFPDGQEIQGDVAAVRFNPQTRGLHHWIAPGPDWEVLAPREGMRTDGTIAWFVLAEMPVGVVGQEIWLGGKPIQIRWLSRPAVLAMRLGFEISPAASNPLTHPWMSPVPESWRARSDFRDALETVRADPLRNWRAELAAEGLYPKSGRKSIAVPPELLGSGVVEAVGVAAPIGERLRAAVGAHTAARWRMALARLWAMDSGLSLRVRQAFAGAGEFVFGAADSDRVIAPVWTADDEAAAMLLAILLEGDDSLAERARSVREWLDGLPDTALWIIDDGQRSRSKPVSATLGVMRFAAGDASAILMNSGPEIARPSILTTRTMRTLRPLAGNRGGAVYRIGGVNRRVSLVRDAAILEPPGLVTGPMRTDWTMARLAESLTKDSRAISSHADPSMVLTVDDMMPGGTANCTLIVTIPAADLNGETDRWECRVWIGPFGRTRAVVLVDSAGDSRIQPMQGASGPKIELPIIERGATDSWVRIEIRLPAEAAEADGLVHLGVEIERGNGVRTAWPRRMLPWQIEPGRRVVDPSQWFGDLGP